MSKSSTLSGKLHLEDGHFKDEMGRLITLRGVNFAADVKLPAKGSHRYVNSPCTLEEADEHFTRLKAIGFNTIRFVYVWDALQPDAPDQVDEEYIEFAIAMVRKAIEKYDFYVFMDSHQDIWSRHCGGSGAPKWTLYAAGFDPEYFHETHCAMLWDPAETKSVKMQWASNYHRLICQTMFTLFFAGPEYAPACELNGKNIGVYLKDQYFWALGQFMKRMEAANLGPKLLGWESMNEPGHGLIGYEHLDKFPKSRTHVKLGTTPTPLQAMLLGQGIPQNVETYKFTSFGLKRVEESQRVAPKRETWLTSSDLKKMDKKYGWTRSWPGGCIWEFHGVYDSKSQKLLKPNYFRDAHKKSASPVKDSPAVVSLNSDFSSKESPIKESPTKVSPTKGSPTKLSPKNGTPKNGSSLLDTPDPSASTSECPSALLSVHSKLSQLSFKGHETPEELALLDTLDDIDPKVGPLMMTRFRVNGDPELHLFVDNFYVRHWMEFSELVTSVNSEWFQFMQAPVNTPPPHMQKLYPGLIDPKRVVYTPHFYDGMTLMLKRWRWLNVDAIGVMRDLYSNPIPALRFGDSRIARSFAEQFEFLKEEGRERLGKDVPFLISEIGIPYDMNNKAAYTDGYWDNQIRAMDANLKALEKTYSNYTLWCYAVHNSHDFGDGFAGEDLSIWSKDDLCAELRGLPENGLRAAAAVVRPAPIAMAGNLSSTDFNIRKGTFTLTVRPSVDAPSEIYIPRFHFPVLRPLVTSNVTGGHLEVRDQVLIWDHGNSPGEQTLVVQGEPQFKDALYSYFEGAHRSAQVVGRQLKFFGQRMRSGHY